MTSHNRMRAHLIERAVAAMPTAAAAELGWRPAQEPPPAIRDAEAAPLLTPIRPEPAATPRVTAETLSRAGLCYAQRGRLREEIELVQHQLLRTMGSMASEAGRHSRLLLVTSARPGEGKSFASLNLAASFALNSDYQVLLVDADGKHRSLGDLLGCAALPGLRQLAGGNAILETLLVPTAIERLSILPYGAPSRDDPGAPPAAAMAAVLLRAALARPDRLIILDTPPCLATSDASNLAAIAGQLILVVEAERTQRDEVEAALDVLESCPAVSLLLNQARLHASHTFGIYTSPDTSGAA